MSELQVTMRSSSIQSLTHIRLFHIPTISTSDFACCFVKEKIGQVLLGIGSILNPESSWDRVFWLWMKGKYYSLE